MSKAKVSVAQQAKSNKFDLSHSHVTTTDFFCPRPVSIIEMEPNSSIKIDLSTTARLSPLVEPTYADIQVVNRAFFVPMRTIFPRWNEFITSAPTVDSRGNQVIISEVPSVLNSVLVQLFTNQEYGNASLAPEIARDYDFSVYFGAKINHYYFLPRGKALFNILVSLGYKIDFMHNSPDHAVKMSALPILAYCRVFFDWIRNSSYDNFAHLEKYFVNYDNRQTYLDDEVLNELLDVCYQVCYRSDYFTAAFDEPLGPNNDGSYNPVFVPDLTGFDNNQISTDGNAATINNGNGVDPLNFVSHYAQMMVHKLQDWLTRKQVVGTRSLDRYLAEFGVQLESSKLNRSVALGKNNVHIMIHDVMQTSPDMIDGTSQGFGVGSYSGKGVGQDGGNICHFNTDEFGYVIVVSYIEPRISYPFGRDRMLQHLSQTDFFTPEFDGVGNQAIRNDELSAGFMVHNPIDYAYMPNGIFGWTPRYAEYKTKHDYLSGDFIIQSKNTSYEGWYLTRDFMADHMNDNMPIHDLEFTMAKPYEFNSIFFDQTSEFDHFIMRYILNVEKHSHIKPLYDMYDYEDESRTLLMDLNGTKVTD